MVERWECACGDRVDIDTRFFFDFDRYSYGCSMCSGVVYSCVVTLRGSWRMGGGWVVW